MKTKTIPKPPRETNIFVPLHFIAENWLNVKNVAVVIFIGQFIISTAIHFLFESKTFVEYADSFYIFVTSIKFFFTFCEIIIQKMTMIFELIGYFESNMKRRKLNMGHLVKNLKYELSPEVDEHWWTCECSSFRWFH